ncbi:MAG: bile acid:sodium symporter [Hyphomicrobium sp.]|nr:bile acid:sodium symporter [Hyphomicrobium sp.]
MLPALIDFGVPICVILLMFIAGTEITFQSLPALRRSPRAVLTGSLGQLLITPAVGLAVISATGPVQRVAACVMLLSFCPGGGISTYYTYIARANVSLSALITAISTLLCLLTIPLWLSLFPHFGTTMLGLAAIPATQILGQLLLFMGVPLAAGAILQRKMPEFVSRHGPYLRTLSFIVIGIVLILSVISMSGQLSDLARDIAASSALFIVLAMAVAHVTTIGIPPADKHAVIIESAVRNIAVALLLGKSLLDTQGLTILVGFLTVYFVIELVIIMGYASVVQKANLKFSRA